MQFSTIGLLGFALVMVHSASMTMGEPMGMMDLLTSRHTIYALAAVAALVAASQFNISEAMHVRGLSSPIPWMLLATFILVGLTYVPGVSRTINNASRWIWLGVGDTGLMFQPSEVFKFMVVIAVAWWCAKRRGIMHRFLHGVFPMLLLVGAAFAILIDNDFGTSALIVAVCGVVLLAGGARFWQLLLLLPPAGALLGVFIYLKPHRVERLMIFLDPYADPNDRGYQLIQGMVAFAEGGVWGKGIGEGIQKFGYLPTDTSDMLFAVICEETGLIGATFVMGMYVMLMWAGIAIITRHHSTFARLATLGIIFMVVLQALINIAVVTVMVPTKGIALPLLSAGGTGWVATGFALGLVAAMDRAYWLEIEAGEPTMEQIVASGRLEDGPDQVSEVNHANKPGGNPGGVASAT